MPAYRAPMSRPVKMNAPRFHIHGDNVVECERAFVLVCESLSERVGAIVGPYGAAACPEFSVELPDADAALHFTMYPGFGRWNQDILESLFQRGALLKEAPDAIISRAASDSEEPLVAIEFSAALPAGNQAWQRNGRAYSFGLTGIPYLYVAEIGGYELDSRRGAKSVRMPNPAAPFSYLSYSLERGSVVLPVFTASPGADETSRQTHSAAFGERELANLIRGLLLDEPTGVWAESLRRKTLALVKNLADSARRRSTLASAQWERAYRAIEGGDSLVDFLAANSDLAWSKKAYIKTLTDTARELMALASKYAIGLTSRDLPMCVIKSAARREFASEIEELYPNLPEEFSDWLRRDEHLVICWIMGFKPRGDDARPDRGLPPMTRMLVGENQDLLSVVYGPARRENWLALIDDPIALSQQNGLWNSILSISDAVLIDSATDDVTNHGFLRSHWSASPQRPTIRNSLVAPAPETVGEHDVDTALHMILGRLAGDAVFEGLCNPPGGDWSGLSLRTAERSAELRWLSLPRVSGRGTKRPDHVFQIFADGRRRPIILAVESKGAGRSVERGIGSALVGYVRSLLESPASIERGDTSDDWRRSERILDSAGFAFASTAAFISNSPADIEPVRSRANADLIMACRFYENGKRCEIALIPSSPLGEEAANHIRRIDAAGYGVSFRVG